MTRKHMAAIGLVIGAAASSSTSAMAAEQPVQFAPHRAVYEIALANAAPGSGVADMSGRMVYELSGSACEGYTQNMRFVTRMTNQEGTETINDMRTSSWEELAGHRLRFSSSQYQDNAISEASQGDAARDAAATGTRVDLVKPQKKSVKLPADIYFPMQHAATLIQSARSGRKILAANLYDGSERGDKYYATTAMIGKKYDTGPVSTLSGIKDGARLASLESWPMAISYFELGKDKQDSLPAYELAFRYFENGVTADLKIDYGAFAIKGEIKQLTLLEPTPCPAGGAGK